MMMMPRKGEEQVCTEKWGAKMGIGRNRKCQCPTCINKKATQKVVRKVQHAICEAAEEHWVLRNEKYQEYCAGREFATPRSKRAARGGGQGGGGGAWSE